MTDSQRDTQGEQRTKEFDKESIPAVSSSKESAGRITQPSREPNKPTTIGGGSRQPLADHLPHESGIQESITDATGMVR